MINNKHTSSVINLITLFWMIWFIEAHHILRAHIRRNGGIENIGAPVHWREAGCLIGNDRSMVGVAHVVAVEPARRIQQIRLAAI